MGSAAAVAVRTGTIRVAAGVSFLLGIAGIAYWGPALLGAPAGKWDDTHPAAYIQRVTALALEQYPPQMRAVVPVLGFLFCAASVLQIGVALLVLGGSEPALPWLRGISYAKQSFFIASALLLGLAVFSANGAGQPAWWFSAGHWLASLLMIAVYHAILGWDS
jgi:hypothetical protein